MCLCVQIVAVVNSVWSQCVLAVLQLHQRIQKVCKCHGIGCDLFPFLCFLVCLFLCVCVSLCVSVYLCLWRGRGLPLPEHLVKYHTRSSSSHQLLIKRPGLLSTHG